MTVLCNALEVSMRTLQRWKKSECLEDKRQGPKHHSRALSEFEQQKALQTLNGEEFCNDPPNKVVARLADQGKYLCSASTMYRLLRRENLLGHRTRGKKPTRVEPLETIASEPNQVWCWDITYLRSDIRGKYFRLYMYIDIYSRKILGWEINLEEREQIAVDLFLRILASEKISGDGIRVHNDNGSAMKGTMFVEKLRELGVIQSCSRPSVSNDNPFAESLFKTMKYRPEYPYGPFADVDAATVWVKKFVHWYNNEHLHSGIGYVTPSSRHTGDDVDVLKRRQRAFETAQASKPERWTGKPFSWSRPQAVELNAAGCRRMK